jgi:Carboxypeptidase regulatory-like domain
MNSSPRPTAGRVASLIWFPFFFVAAFSLMGLFAFGHPTPHGVPVQVVGSSAQVARVTTALDTVRANGFSVTAAPSAAAARTAVEGGDAAAAYLPGTATATVLVAPASSASQATYLTAVFTQVAEAQGADIRRVDAAPLATGDVSGVSLMFVGLPLMLVGLITALVLLQFGAWGIRAKAITVAATGTFATIFVYLVGTALHVIPADEWLLLFGFMLTQAIGWLAVGAAYFTRQFFMPVIMTFVLVLGLSTAGATVAGDMLPTPLAWLNDVLPFAQWVDAARASAYFGGRHLALPLTILGLWDVAGAALLIASAVVARKRAERMERRTEEEARADVHDESASDATGRVHGSVRLPSGVPIVGALVMLLAEGGRESARGATDVDGHFAIADVPVGLHHLLVTAEHCEPVVATIAVREGASSPAHAITLIGWDDPSANLVAARSIGVEGAHSR